MMGTGIERIYVGRERPMLHSVREFLLERFVRGTGARRFGKAPDLSSVTLVLPGARAGRRLLELLTNHEGAAADGAIVPPRILTLGAWTRLGARAERPAAGGMARLGAWIAALRSLGKADLRTIARMGAAEDAASAAGWLGVARLVDACHAELAGEGARFAHVLERGPLAPDFADAERWGALARAQGRYEQILGEAGLGDAELTRLAAIEAGKIDTGALSGGGSVVLAGIGEMNGVARRMIDAVAGRCSVLVCAPAAERERFDAHGCVVPSAWETARLDIPESAVTAAEGPGEQAALALQVVERWAGASAGSGMRPDEVTIGVPDLEVEERLLRLAGRLEGVPARRAEGTALACTRPVKLLLGVAAYLERRDFTSLAALVRHPDVEAWMARGAGVRPDSWLRVLDEYQKEHLHGRVDGRWLTTKPEELELLTTLHTSLHDLLGRGGATLLGAEPAAPAEWGGAAWDVIRAVYGRAGATLDPATHEACVAIEEVLRELARLPRGIGAHLCLRTWEAMRLVVREVAGVSVPERGDAPAIDLVGWLELAPDDAPRMIVTGMNEGIVASRTGADPLLPDGLRRVLGLSDRRARLARDAYAAGIVLASRAPGDLVLIFGRRSGAGDPLAPSRLLLMGAPEDLPARVRQWTGEGEATSGTGAPLMVRHGAESAFGGAARILEREGTRGRIDEMSVTSFRDYLASPLGFYLKHVQRLQSVGEEGVELDALGFGTLLHDVLRMLVAESVAGSRDAGRIEAFLASQLDDVARMRYGEDPRPEVALQLEQARERLRVLAREQAEWAAQGWRVAHTEWEPERRSAFLEVDGERMYLRGRIDRIDVNEREGAWAILDYKTGSAPPEPGKALPRNGTWIDPQLPLYRHLAARLGLAGEPRLAWFAVPRDLAKIGLVHTEWTPQQLAGADEAARGVVRAVWRGEFSEPGKEPPGDGILGWLCGGLKGREGDE